MFIALICLFKASSSFSCFIGVVWCISTESVDPHTAHGAPCELREYFILEPNLAIGFVDLDNPSASKVCINSVTSLLSSSVLRYCGFQLILNLFPVCSGIV